MEFTTIASVGAWLLVSCVSSAHQAQLKIMVIGASRSYKPSGVHIERKVQQLYPIRHGDHIVRYSRVLQSLCGVAGGQKSPMTLPPLDARETFFFWPSPSRLRCPCPSAFEDVIFPRHNTYLILRISLTTPLRQSSTRTTKKLSTKWWKKST